MSKLKNKTEEVKSVFQSKTVNGGIILLIIAVLQIFGVEISENEIGTVTEALATVVGFGLVVWGRFTAKKKVTLTGKE